MNMKKRWREALCALAVCVASVALAHEDYQCRVPRAEMRPQMELQRKLKDEGWKVRMVQTENGCYEVYGFDPKKNRVEAFFDPKTFERLDTVGK